ncbi:MAG: response regulator [Betaproteobacteria bacterium]|nr:response regulator [Betaproteobacteria bacterium]
MSGAVMIVDDSLTVRMDLVEAFSAEGLRAIGCENIAKARAVLAVEDVALAVLDVLLPDGSGVELVREIRAMPGGAAMPILMLSTEAEVRDRIRGLAIGSDDYAGKPYERDYVVARALELLGRRAGPSQARQTTVLVIDDSATFRNELCRALEREGYIVLSAASGEEGLRSAALHRPSAIIVDGVLPGIDGATVIRKLRLDAAMRQTPCVMLTGSTLDRSAELNALDAGADAFVRKEENMELVLARLAAVLRAGSGPERATPSLHSPKKILAVDDSETYLDALTSTLRGEGYDVIAARSGDEALEMLGAQPVDCILLDRIMPGLDGTDACRRIKASAATRDIPIIMLTGSESREAIIEGLSAGADDYVLKSSEDDVLKARLRAQLRRRQIEDESRHIRLELLRKELEAVDRLAQQERAHKTELERQLAEIRRTQEALAKHAERLSIVHEIDRALIGEIDLHALAAVVLQPLRTLLGVPRVVVNLFDFAAGEVEWLAAAGRRRTHIGPGVRYPLSFMGDLEALRRGEPQVIDTHELPSGPEKEALLTSGVRAYMAVPMIAANELLGALSFGGEHTQFTPEQATIAREVATQLAIAITQARLFERVKRHAEELEQKVRERTSELEVANRELEAFSYSVSHDLRAPLRAVDGYALMLQEDYTARLDDEGRRLLGVIRGSAAQMGRLIDDLLKFSQVGRKPLASAPLDMRALAAESIGELSPAYPTVRVELRELPAATGDRALLKHVWMNLIGNALKYSARSDGARIEISGRVDGAENVYSVRDNGAGFDMRYYDKLFKVFQRLHREDEFEGTGVGLAIVQRVVVRHGGRVWGEGAVADGACFSFALPTGGTSNGKP